MGEEKYSVVSASAIVEAKYKTGDHVYVKDCGRPYSGKVIFVGEWTLHNYVNKDFPSQK